MPTPQEINAALDILAAEFRSRGADVEVRKLPDAPSTIEHPVDLVGRMVEVADDDGPTLRGKVVQASDTRTAHVIVRCSEHGQLHGVHWLLCRPTDEPRAPLRPPRVPGDWRCPRCKTRDIDAIRSSGIVICVNGHESS